MSVSVCSKCGRQQAVHDREGRVYQVVCASCMEKEKKYPYRGYKI